MGDSLKDIFICHASEDKPGVVLPLYECLISAGFKIWYDSAEINWGDSITQKVNWGLIHSKYVIVVLSKSFLEKKWPNREFNSVLNMESSSGEVRVLPLLVGEKNDLHELSVAYPLLNDKRYLEWSGSGDDIVQELKKLFPYKFTGHRSQNKYIEVPDLSSFSSLPMVDRPNIIFSETPVDSLSVISIKGFLIQPKFVANVLFDDLFHGFENKEYFFKITDEYLRAVVGRVKERLLSVNGGEQFYLYVHAQVSTHEYPVARVLESLVKTAKLETGQFTVLLDESVFSENTQLVGDLVSNLKAAKFKVGIFKFGTGYSSLAYIKRFQPSEIFIDKSFVLGLGSDGANAAIIAAIISLSKNLNIRVVAEGVSNEDQKNLLKTMGCDSFENLIV